MSPQEWEEGCLGLRSTECEKTGTASNLPPQQREWRVQGWSLRPLATTLTSLSLGFLICKTRARPPFSGLIRDNVWKPSSSVPVYGRCSVKGGSAFLRCRRCTEQRFPDFEISWHSDISEHRLCSTHTGSPMVYFAKWGQFTKINNYHLRYGNRKNIFNTEI